jgi:nitrite reductase (NO-forming)
MAIHDLKFVVRRTGLAALCAAALAVSGCDRPTTLSGGTPVQGSPPPVTASTPQVSPPASAATASSTGVALPAADTYDIAKMDFKPGPAKLSSERHTGAFAAGDALSTDLGVAVKPLVQNPVKEVRLDTTHKVIDLAPGVKFTAWTFGDQVPGPVVRVRVGDRVKFSMTNRSDEHAPGLEISPPMMHSMDFHAAMVSPQD